MDKDLLAGIDPAWLTDTLHELVEVDSTVGYYRRSTPGSRSSSRPWATR